MLPLLSRGLESISIFEYCYNTSPTAFRESGKPKYAAQTIEQRHESGAR